MPDLVGALAERDALGLARRRRGGRRGRAPPPWRARRRSRSWCPRRPRWRRGERRSGPDPDHGRLRSSAAVRGGSARPRSVRRTCPAPPYRGSSVSSRSVGRAGPSPARRGAPVAKLKTASSAWSASAQSHRHPLLLLVVSNRGLGRAGPKQRKRPAQPEQIAVQREDRGVLALSGALPAGRDAAKVSSACGSGTSPRQPNAANSRRALPAPPRSGRDRRGSRSTGTDALAVLLAHEEQRHVRREQKIAAASRTPAGSTSAARRSPPARLPTWSWFCTQTTNRSPGTSSAGTPVPPPPVGRVAAVVDVAPAERACHRTHAAEVGVVPASLAGERHVHRVVEVVGPLRVQPEAADLARPHQPGIVAVALGDDARSGGRQPLPGGARPRRSPRPGAPGSGRRSGRPRRAGGRRGGTRRSSTPRCPPGSGGPRRCRARRG